MSHGMFPRVGGERDSYLSHLVFHAFDETGSIGDNVLSGGCLELETGSRVKLAVEGAETAPAPSIGFTDMFQFPYWDRAARLALGPQGDRLAIAADDVFSLYEIPTE